MWVPRAGVVLREGANVLSLRASATDTRQSSGNSGHARLVQRVFDPLLCLFKPSKMIDPL